MRATLFNLLLGLLGLNGILAAAAAAAVLLSWRVAIPVVWRLLRRPAAAALLLLGPAPMLAGAGAEEIPRGTIVEKVACLSDPSESYALYLPSGAAPGSPRPAIFAVDPAARGRVPVERFRMAAEKHGYIVAGSNNARNGPAAPALRSLLLMIQDAGRRFPTDPRRTVLAGFSGGARTATQFVRLRPEPVAAVIAVGAGLSEDVSPRDLPPTFFLGIVGQRDFNYRELLALEPRLRADGVEHGLIVTEGRHAWPSEEECLRAVEWLELRAMAAGLRARDPELIETVHRGESGRARAQAEGRDFTGAARSWDQVVALFRGLRDGTEGEEQARQLRAGDGYRRQAKREEWLERREQGWIASSRQILTTLVVATPFDLDPAGAARDLEVPRLLADLRKPDAAEAALAYRLLFVLATEAGTSGGQFLERGDLPRARAFFALGVEATAHEPARQADFLVALACAHAAGRNEKQALASLREAIGKGFSDPAPLQRRKCFEGLRATPAFAEVVRSLEPRQPE